MNIIGLKERIKERKKYALGNASDMQIEHLLTQDEGVTRKEERGIVFRWRYLA